MLEADQIIASAMAFNPVAIRVGFSGGRDSLAVTHWMMTNVLGCEVFHCNTGIGIERTRQYVRDTCKAMGWPLHEIRAIEECAQVVENCYAVDCAEVVRALADKG